MVKRRFCFTLVELLIVMAILVSVTAIVGIGATKLIKQERFRSSTTLVLDKLKFAQDLMLILQTDVVLKFEKNEKGELQCNFRTEKTLNIALKRIVNSNTTINGIEKIVYEDADSHTNIESPIEITFYAGGAKMNHGYLHLYADKDGKEEEIIYLPGYPAPIGKNALVSKEQAKMFKNYDNNIFDDLYPKEIKRILEEKKNETNVPSA